MGIGPIWGLPLLPLDPLLLLDHLVGKSKANLSVILSLKQETESPVYGTVTLSKACVNFHDSQSPRMLSSAGITVL